MGGEVGVVTCAGVRTRLAHERAEGVRGDIEFGLKVFQSCGGVVQIGCYAGADLIAASLNLDGVVVV